MNQPKRLDPPDETAGDHAHKVVSSAVALVPGGEWLFSTVIAPPVELRKQRWMNEVADAIVALQQQEFLRIEDLRENDGFIDTVLQASQTALRTSQQEKREALRNAVLNSALPNPPDAWHQSMFLMFVDTLTVWHLKLLAWFTDPPAWYQANNVQPRQIGLISSFTEILPLAFPELARQDELVAQCVSDLQTRGLVARFNYHTPMGGDGIYYPRGTTLGRQFLAFISAPQT